MLIFDRGMFWNVYINTLTILVSLAQWTSEQFDLKLKSAKKHFPSDSVRNEPFKQNKIPPWRDQLQ